MNILNWVKRGGWRAVAAICVAGAGLGVMGAAQGANVDVQVSSFTDNPDPAIRGGQITYTTVVKNGGPAIATNVVVTWPIPANTTFVSVSDGAGGGTCLHNGGTPGTVTCTYAAVPVDITSVDWKTIALVVQTGASTPGTISPSATATQTDNTDTAPGNDSLTQNTTVNAGADLSFAISGAPNPAVGAGNVTWSITGSNLGPDTSGPITVTVPLPGTVTYVSGAGTGWACNYVAPNAVCTRAALASGVAYPTLSIVTKISSQVSGGTLTVGGSIAEATVGDPVTANNSATDSVSVNPGLDLSVTQDVPSPASANAGGVAMTFVLRPSNLGPYDATTGANVTFPLPAGFTLTSANGTNGWTCSSAGTPITVTCSLGSNFASAANSVLTIVTGTPATVSGNTNYTLTGTIAVNTGGPTDPISPNNSAARPVIVTPIGLNLGVSKSKTPAIVAQNANMTSTITVSNAAGGVATAAGTITVTDVLNTAFETYVSSSGTSWACVAVTVVTTETVTCTYNAARTSGQAPSVLTIITKAMAAGTATNNASVAYSGTPGDYNPANNGPASRSVTVTAVPNSPDLVAGLTVTTAGGVATTLEFNETTVNYVATLTNASVTGADATDTRMTLTIPAVINNSSVLGAIGIVVTNTSGLSTATYTCTPTAGTLTTSTITCNQAVATVLKPGDLVIFTVPVSRPLTANTFTNPPNVAVTSTTQGDPTPTNNSATGTVTIDPIADIELVSKLIDSANPAQAGTNVSYTLTIKNNGPSPAQGVSVADVFTVPGGDAGFTFISVLASDSGTCSGLDPNTVYGPGTPTLTCGWVADVGNGNTRTVTVIVRPNWMSGVAVRTMSNTATVSTITKENTAGTDNVNNSKTATLTINPAAVDALINNTDLVDPLGYDPAATAIGTASTNNDITYDVAVTNNGPSLVSGLGFTYAMTPPNGKTVIFRGDGGASTVASATTSGTIAGSICDNIGSSVTGPATLTLTCTFAAPGHLASGAAAVHRYLVFRVGSPPATGGDAYNTNSTVITNETDNIVVLNNSEGETTTVRQRVDLTIAKTPSVNPVQLRQPFNWTITLTNTGPGNSNTTTLTDTLPAGMGFFGAAPSFTTTGVVKIGTCGVSGQVMTCNISTGSGNPLNVGEVATVTVPVRMTAYPSGGTATNCASATTDQVDPAASNNTLVCTPLTVQRSSLAGRVFNDPNANGLFAYTTGALGSDTGMNVINIVVLTGTDAYGNPVSLTQSTAGSAASAGAYLFNDLSPANASGYTITEAQPTTHINGPVDPPAPTLSGTPTAGDQGVYARGGLSGDSIYSVIKLAGNQAGTNYNFPEVRKPTLSGRVYIDVNADNSYASGTDSDIGGATVRLLDAADSSVVATTTTSTTAGSVGTYSFTNLDPLITYVLEEPLPTSPTGLSNQALGVNVGAVNAVVTGIAAANTPSTNTDRITGIDLSSGVDGINYNFGEGGTLSTTKVLTFVNGAAPGASVKAGDVLLYTVTTTTANASASTSLCESTPANTSYTGGAEGWTAAQGACTAGTSHNQVITVNVGTPVSKTYTVTVANPIADNVTTIDNTVAVTNGTCTTCTVSKPTGAKLAILKTVAAATVNAGQTGSYTLTVSNLGGSATSGLVTLTDTLPTGLSYASTGAGTLTGMTCSAAGQVVTCSGTPNLAAGASATVLYTVNVAVSATGTLTNDVKFTTGTIGGDPRTPSCNAATPIAGANSQSTDKLCAKASVTVINGALATTKVLTSVNGGAPGASVKAGDVLLYTVTTTTANASASTSLCESTPANTSYTGGAEGWSAAQGACAVGTTHNQVITVNVGTPVSKTYTVTVANPIADNVTTIDNTVAVTNGTCTTCTVSKPTGAKLAILKTVAAATVNAGQTGSYTLTVSNLGGSATSGLVTLTDTLPTGLSYASTGAGTLTGMTCSAAGQVVTCSGTPNLAAGASATVLYTVNVAVSATGTLTNDVKFTTGSIGGDPRTPSCNAATPLAGANSQSTDKLCAKASVNVTTSISGVVFNDRNRGGTKDGTEPGIAGVSLKLVAGSSCAASAFVYAGLTNPVTTAASTGAYSFSSVPYGSQYTICETQPSGYADGPVGGGTSINVGILAATGSTGNNFPEVLGSLSGTVFSDYGSTTVGNNNNGTQEAGELGIGSVTASMGVPMTLSGTPTAGPSLAAVSLTIYTDASGNYSFADLFPGTYLLTEGVIPVALGTFNDGINTAGLVSGGTAGTAGAVGINTISTIILAAGSQGTANNFAELPVTSISGTVYLDLNENTTMEVLPTDSRLGGVTLTLYPGSACTGTPTGTAITSDTGVYSFLNLSSGVTYTVCETQPSGYEEGTVNPGTNGALTAATINAITVTNLPVAGSVDNNFGERGGTLSGFVYVDNNNNGIKDTAEIGIANVRVTLSGTTGSGLNVCSLSIPCVATTTAAGAFSFVGVPPGTYQLVEAQTDIDGSLYGDGKETAGVAGGVVDNTTQGSQPYQNTIKTIAITPGVLASSAGNVSGYLFGEVPRTAFGIKPPIVSGYIYMDRKHSRIRPVDASLEGQPSWTVTLSQNGVFVCTVTSDANGFYQFDNLRCPTYAASGLPTGNGFSIRFSNNGNNLPNVTTSGGSAGTTAPGTISGITLNPNDEITEQNLPLDPAGVVYDVLTRQPVAGAVVTISGPPGFSPVTHLVGGALAQNQTTGLDGRYGFWLQNDFPSGTYSLSVAAPAGYYPGASQILPACIGGALAVGSTPDPGLVQQSNDAPALTVTQHAPAATTACVGMVAGGATTTQYYFAFSVTNGVSAAILNNHIPLDPVTPTKLMLTKTGDKKLAEVGDTVLYTIAVRNGSGATLPQVTVKDRLPAGFTFIRGTAAVTLGSARTVLADPLGGFGPVLGFNIGNLPTGQTSTLTYRVRIGVGSLQGTGINTARAYGCGYASGCLDPVSLQALPHGVESNEGQHRVEVTGGVFTDDACLLGKVFVDCNNNHIQDAEELGIPGVRLYLENGQFMVTDSEGKYSRCGITPRSHVLTPDPSTLPRGSVLTTTSNRNLGDANSLFIDLKNGELHRGDFAEGSCANPVLEQVKARRSQGEVRSVETEKPQAPALRFQSKPLSTPQQGTDSADQPLVQPRQGASDAR